MTGKGVRRAVVPPMGVADSLLPVFFEALHFAQARPKACSLRLSIYARPRLAIAGLFGQQKTCTAASFPPNFPRVSVFAWARPARRPLLALVDHHTVPAPQCPPYESVSVRCIVPRTMVWPCADTSAEWVCARARARAPGNGAHDGAKASSWCGAKARDRHTHSCSTLGV